MTRIDTDPPAWLAAAVDGDIDGAAAAITSGASSTTADWPTIAVETGAVDSTEAYYDALHGATARATRATVTKRERADDRQVVHAVRAMDDCRRTSNELAERLAEWAGTVDDGAGTGLAYARDLAAREPDPGDEPIVSLAGRVVDLAEEADALEESIERTMASVAPNLTALAGSVLGARLLSLAGGLESLAKKPSGTIQVLGAEDALFAHLRGQATSPKHGIIFTHEAVRGTREADRGSAARALAGKLAIAARIDHYSGDYRPELEAELAERLETIRARAARDDGEAKSDDETGSKDETDGDVDD